MMYEGLVKRLRTHNGWALNKTLDEAADAIEFLYGQYYMMRKTAKELAEKIPKLSHRECEICANADNEYCFACDNGSQFKPQINADLIRAMSDEELAERLYLSLCVHVLDNKVKCKDDGCRKCWLRWLREKIKV